MKKYLLILVMALCLVLPLTTKADVTSKNLKEALQEEEIALDKAFDSYKETDDQAIIYLFRGNGCGYCRAFLTFLNSIVGEYGKYFKVVSYEVWYDEDNSKLMQQVGTYLNQPAEGVPYIVIGDKVFAGYASSWDEDIKSAIKTLYDTKKSDRYDVMVEMVEHPKDENGNVIKNGPSTLAIVLCTVLATVAGVGVTIAFTNYKFASLEDKIELLMEKNNRRSHNEEKEETKKTSKRK